MTKTEYINKTFPREELKSFTWGAYLALAAAQEVLMRDKEGKIDLKEFYTFASYVEDFQTRLKPLKKALRKQKDNIFKYPD